MAEYQANWLRGAEIYHALADLGMEGDAALATLRAMVRDHKPVCTGEADPEADLFRLDRIIPEDRARRWMPDPNTIDPFDLSIEAPSSHPGAQRPFPRPRAILEASAARLRATVGGPGRAVGTANDAALFPELHRLIAERGISPWAACIELANQGRIGGHGVFESKARRLLRKFNAAEKR